MKNTIKSMIRVSYLRELNAYLNDAIRFIQSCIGTHHMPTGMCCYA